MEIDSFLADSVTSADGKLYALGVGWNTINAVSLPARHDRIGIGIILQVPYLETDTIHRFSVRLEDEDGQGIPLADAPAGAEGPEIVEGKVVRLDSEFSVGRPPGLLPGDDQVVPLAINIDGLTFDRVGGFRFVIAVDGKDLKHLRFRVVASPEAEKSFE